MEVSRDELIGADVGSYRVERKVASGGMGTVYLGVHPGIGSRVAIKVLSDRCAGNATLVERFFSEARAVNLIRHEAIVNVLDMATLPDGRPYLVMEYLDGESLGAMVRRTQHLPLGGVANAIGEVLSALAAAHAAGIVHRDLKPDNIYITALGRAKVLDFGIAKLARSLVSEHAARTGTEDFLGTPAYMSPEQITNAKTVDARSDIYAVGVVLYEAVTGRVPFIGTAFEIMRAHTIETPMSPRSRRADVPEALDAVIMTALAKDPAERFATAAAMGSALAACRLPMEPLVSRTASAPMRSIVETPAAPSASAPPTTPTLTRPASRKWIPIAIALAVAAGGVTFAFVIRGGKRYVAARIVDHTIIRKPERFDVNGFMSSAITLAKAQAEDAELVEIQLNPVEKGGLVDITQDSSIENRIMFVSKRTAPCAIVVMLRGKRARVERRDEYCSATPVRPPSCRIGEVFANSLNDLFEEQIGTHLPMARGLFTTSVRYTAVPGEKFPQWQLSQSGDTSNAPDDCVKR